eukprot:scaffold164848_cov48-Prasinocladus_malaysianus.AAC.3
MTWYGFAWPLREPPGVFPSQDGLFMDPTLVPDPIPSQLGPGDRSATVWASRHSTYPPRANFGLRP